MTTCVLVLLLFERCVFDESTAVLAPVFWLQGTLVTPRTTSTAQGRRTVDFQYSDMMWLSQHAA